MSNETKHNSKWRRVIDGKKECNSCHNLLELNAFRDGSGCGGKKQPCRKCEKILAKKRYIPVNKVPSIKTCLSCKKEFESRPLQNCCSKACGNKHYLKTNAERERKRSREYRRKERESASYREKARCTARNRTSESRRKEREKSAAKSGRVLGPYKPRINSYCKATWENNAHQAFDYWLRHIATKVHLDIYYKDKPFLDHRLTDLIKQLAEEALQKLKDEREKNMSNECHNAWAYRAHVTSWVKFGEHTCKNCGAQFSGPNPETGRSRAKYCNSECKKEFNLHNMKTNYSGRRETSGRRKTIGFLPGYPPITG